MRVPYREVTFLAVSAGDMEDWSNIESTDEGQGVIWGWAKLLLPYEWGKNIH